VTSIFIHYIIIRKGENDMSKRLSPYTRSLKYLKPPMGLLDIKLENPYQYILYVMEHIYANRFRKLLYLTSTFDYCNMEWIDFKKVETVIKENLDSITLRDVLIKTLYMDFITNGALTNHYEQTPENMELLYQVLINTYQQEAEGNLKGFTWPISIFFEYIENKTYLNYMYSTKKHFTTIDITNLKEILYTLKKNFGDPIIKEAIKNNQQLPRVTKWYFRGVRYIDENGKKIPVDDSINVCSRLISLAHILDTSQIKAVLDQYTLKTIEPTNKVAYRLIHEYNFTYSPLPVFVYKILFN